VSERRVSLEKDDAQVESVAIPGKADTTGWMSNAGPPVAVPVSLEAGRKKGSIKKSRLEFAELIAESDAAAAEQTRLQRDQGQRIAKVRQSAEDMQVPLDVALAREQSVSLAI
jgi:hypothetical protein